MRQISLDTETTGIHAASGHRIIELGAVEIIDGNLTGNDFHVYLNPKRNIDPRAMEVHGITDEFVADKPEFNEIMQEFINFIQGAKLLIHNAPFDVSFINQEFSLAGLDKTIEDFCEIIDTLPMARQLHPGRKNSLDALCSRYSVDSSCRKLPGALIDAKLLGEVYLLLRLKIN